MVSTGSTAAPVVEPVETVWEVASRVRDPELPMLTLVDLGVLREVSVDAGTVVAVITPTYSGCPAMATMRDDLVQALQAAGFPDVRVRVVLDPPWTTDWITAQGRAALEAAGISPPGVSTGSVSTGSTTGEGPVPLRLMPTRRTVHCPRCGSEEAGLVSEFGSTACKALYRCRACLEPFEHIKEI